MSYTHTVLRLFLIVGALLVLDYSAVNAQGRGQGKAKKEAVSIEVAINATRDVLRDQGYDVVRIEEEGDLQVVYYRRGNRGRGRGGGPMERLVIRRTDDRLWIDDAPDGIRIGIEVKLGIRMP